MKFKTLMVIKALVCLVLGIPILLVPKWFYAIFGIDLAATGAYFVAQEYGASLMGNMLLAWFGRNAEESIGRKAITWALFLYDAIGVVITVILALSTKVSFLIWGPVAIYLFFALGFGYFLVKPPKP